MGLLNPGGVYVLSGPGHTTWLPCLSDRQLSPYDIQSEVDNERTGDQSNEEHFQGLNEARAQAEIEINALPLLYFLPSLSPFLPLIHFPSSCLFKVFTCT